MKQTKANVIRVIEAMLENKEVVYDAAKEYEDKELANNVMHEILALEDVLRLFDNKEYFDGIASIFNVTD